MLLTSQILLWAAVIVLAVLVVVAFVLASKPFARARSMNWRGVIPVFASMVSR